MKKILAFSGSSSSLSINQSLAQYTIELLSQYETNLIDLRDYMAPIYSIDIEKGIGIPQNIKKLNRLIEEHDGLLISLPEHNGAVTALFKNTVDWLSRIDKKFLMGKKILLLSASPGKRGAASALEQGSKLLHYFGGIVIDTYSIPQFKAKTHQAFGRLVILDKTLKSDLEEKVEIFQQALLASVQATV